MHDDSKSNHLSKKEKTMLLFSWLRNSKHPARATRRRTQRSSRRPGGSGLRFESLEVRSMMTGMPYPTAAAVDQLVADINYADASGGSFTVNLNPGTTFDLASVNNTTDGGNGLPVIGGAKAVDLAILGNGDTIERVGSNIFRLFDVAPRSSLTLDHVALQDGYVALANGGGIYNAGGNVKLSNCSLSGNTANGGHGGGIYNAGGNVLLDNSSLSNNWAEVVDYAGGGNGGGIFNDSNGTVKVQNNSGITGNWTYRYGDIFNVDAHNFGVLYLDSTSTIGALYGNPAIVLDPNAPQLQIQNASVTEGNTGTVAAGFIVTLSAASTKTITVAYATANGTATAGGDYQAASGVLTFAPGETSKTVNVLVNGDRIGEADETFSVNLSAATNATIFGGSAVGTIVDDEPHISISNVSKLEGGRGQTTLFTFTVTLSTAYDQPVTMAYRTANGTAQSGSDYVASTGKLTFAPGETTKTITIAVNGDSKKEGNETFFVNLFGNSSNSYFSVSQGIGTILNDD
jgi:hypothetical protein